MFKLNPSIHLISSFLLSFLILIVNSVEVNLLMIVVGVIHILMFRQQNWIVILLTLSGLLFLSSVYFLTGYLQGNSGLIVNQNISPLTNGINLGTRVLALGLLGVSLCLSINKEIFIASLIQQLKVPIPIAYSMLVAINFLTLIKQEFDQAKLALKIRGVANHEIPFQALTTMLMRLVRQSEYTATAMEAKGFSNQRKQYEVVTITTFDKMYCVVITSLIIFSFFIFIY